MDDLYSLIVAELPELVEGDEFGKEGSIRLQNDGESSYIAKWEYSKPIPKSLKSYDRT